MCATPLRRRPTVATAVLTPVPVPPPSEADAETIALPTPTSFDAGLALGLTPGQTFGNRYQIISLLGVGGMGAVYHVWDSELALSLALKIIKPESDPIAAQELERRFKRELVLARQVTHTNVIRIHDLGEINGIKYLTMPFIHGTDLARLLATETKLPAERVLALARQIVSGLRAAHEVGVVHRDLKPANILIDDEEKAIITDFGIARSTDAGSFATAATAAGAIIGTLAYMAPEQASGRPADQRADIYALGLILSEMLVGRRGAAGGDTALAMLIERSRHAPPGVRSIDPTIPEPIERLVTKCLEPEPKDRFQSTAELEVALDRLDAFGNERQAAPVEIPRTRSWLPTAAAITLVVLVGLAALTIWMFQRSVTAPPAQTAAARQPVSVLIADFDNAAQDPVFQGSLEQALNIAIEGASFITTYPRATAQTQAAQLRAGASLNLEGARLVARREGINIILTGSIAPRQGGAGYTLTVNAVDPANERVLSTAKADVDDKASVLKGVQVVASTLREALGDTTPESARLAAAETVTTASLEALQLYSKAQDLSSRGREQESIELYQKAIDLDGKFGRAYSGWATALYNLGYRQAAEEKYKQALSFADRMTERERYRTQGAYFLGPGASYEQAIDAFKELTARYPADRAAHNNLGLAYFNTLDFPKAKEQALRAVEISPQSTRYRNNYALYSMYSGDFKVAAEEARKVLEQNKSQFKAYLVLAAAAHAASNLKDARDAYDQMAKAGIAAGTSLASHGLADLALYEGRNREAVDILNAGIEADAKSKNPVAQAAKLVALAEAQLLENENSQAVASAKKAMSLSQEDVTLVPAAFVLIKAGRAAEARAIADGLGKQVQARSRAYGEMIHAEVLRASGRRPDALDALGRARKLTNLWLARFLTGVTLVEAGRFESAQAEFELCLKRRGEATAIFFDDVPSFRYLAPLQYWLARAQDGQKHPGAAESYRAFLALRPEGSKDPLALDARKRLAALQ